MPVLQEKVTVPVPDGDKVSGVLTVPARVPPGEAPAVLLAHGAGGDIDDPLLTYLQIFLAGRGYAALRFNFPYRERKRKVPDKEEVLERTVQAALAFLAAQPAVAPGSIFLGGKSMGGRISSHLAARGTRAAGLLLLAYPLHAPGRPDRVRDQHLSQIRMPTLFLSGTRDALAPYDSLVTAAELPAHATLSWIEGGDHSFRMLRSSGKRAEDVWLEVAEAAAAWLDLAAQGKLKRAARTTGKGATTKTAAKSPSPGKAPAGAAVKATARSATKTTAKAKPASRKGAGTGAPRGNGHSARPVAARKTKPRKARKTTR